MRSCLFALALATFAASAVAEEPAAERAPLGLNLAGVRDWSSEIVFVDVFKAARKWISQAEGKPWGQGGPLELDERGHVKALAPRQYAETIVCTGFEDRFPAGDYTCLYDGRGTVDFTGDARVTGRRPGRLQVRITPQRGEVTARITRTDPRNPVRNLRLIMPGFERTYQKRPFYPEFLRRWRGMQAFRFMDWARTNNSQISRWSERPTPQDHSQAQRGVALEYMVQLCNEQQVDPWFCIPHLADDDFVRRYAELVKSQLHPQRRVYVEYSNECWNGQFAQARYCRDQGQRLGLSSNAYEAQLRFYARRSVEIFKIFAQVLGERRLVRVLAVQAANRWTGQTVLAWQNAAASADAVAIAPYFGHGWGNPNSAAQTVNMSPDELVAALEKDVAQSRERIQAYAALAGQHGLQLLAYEGGQHLVGHGGAENNEALTRLFHAVNRHPGMKQHYLAHLADWQQAGGGLFCIFSSMGRYSKYGSWGLLEYAQDADRAPKYQAVQEYLRH